MKISNKKILIQYTISIAILFIIFMNFNLKKIETANFYFNVEWFFYITLTMIITFALRAWRWQYLMNNETQMVSFISSFKIF
nr:flippase-like domain-containing protein [Candidatus Dependentiae bacterium]